MTRDDSNGYDDIAESFIARRNRDIGVTTVREWSQSMQRGASILELGCGHGVPISRLLLNEGFTLCGVDASPKMIAAFRENCPGARAECAAAEESAFFHRKFDAVVAWGLMFLLSEEAQASLIAKIARALKPGGRFLFTAPREAVTWTDAMTKIQSRSPGRETYEGLLRAAGLQLTGEQTDDGDNHYYFAMKQPTVPAGPFCIAE